MAAITFLARVEENGILTLSQEVQAELGVKTGDEVRVSVARETIENGALPPLNVGMLAALEQIKVRQQDRRSISGEDTQRLLRQARAGGMYGLDATEYE